jgi:hypothetical protein
VQKILHERTGWPEAKVGRPVLDESSIWQGDRRMDAQSIRKYVRGATVVCLVPARTDTAWWHDYAMKGKITFIRGRLKFGGQKNSAPFPSAVVVFDGGGEIHEG